MTIYDTILDYLKQGKEGTLATIIKRVGATPQTVGAKLFIGRDAAIHGTIGGGCVEAEVWQEARTITGGGATRVVHHAMTGTEVAEEGMICGGSVDVLLEPVSIKYRDLYSAIPDAFERGARGLILTNISPGRFSKTLLLQDGTMLGDPVDRALTDTLDQGSRSPHLTGVFLVEPLHITPRLFIYGAGHISQFIARIAKMIDFEVFVVDDRESFANSLRFPEADFILAGDFSEIIEEMDQRPAEYHVIVTRGHKNDAEVLERVLKRPFTYVGMIGSRRKVKIVFDHLLSQGTSPDLLARVHAPIGLDIDAETPQEIAVSIAAELIKIRAQAGAAPAGG